MKNEANLADYQILIDLEEIIEKRKRNVLKVLIRLIYLKKESIKFLKKSVKKHLK